MRSAPASHTADMMLLARGEGDILMRPADEIYRRYLEARRARLAARLGQAREVALGAWQRCREAAHTGDGPAQTKWGAIAAQFEATAHAISGAIQAIDDELGHGEHNPLEW